MDKEIRNYILDGLMSEKDVVIFCGGEQYRVAIGNENGFHLYDESIKTMFYSSNIDEIVQYIQKEIIEYSGPFSCNHKKSRNWVIKHFIICALSEDGIKIIKNDPYEIVFHVVDYVKYFEVSNKINNHKHATNCIESRARSLKIWFDDFPTKTKLFKAPFVLRMKSEDERFVYIRDIIREFLTQHF